MAARPRTEIPRAVLARVARHDIGTSRMAALARTALAHAETPRAVLAAVTRPRPRTPPATTALAAAAALALALWAMPVAAAQVVVRSTLEPPVIGLGETATFVLEAQANGVTGVRFTPEFTPEVP